MLFNVLSNINCLSSGNCFCSVFYYKFWPIFETVFFQCYIVKNSQYLETLFEQCYTVRGGQVQKPFLPSVIILAILDCTKCNAVKSWKLPVFNVTLSNMARSGNWNIGRKSPTCGKSPTDYHIMGVSKTPSYERDSKSQL